MNAIERAVNRLYAWLTRQLSAANAGQRILLLSLLLMLPAINTDLGADDYLHQLIVQGTTDFGEIAQRPRLDLFRFCDPKYSPAFLREGVFTWWDDPGTRLAFLRPVSALTHYVDYTFWPSLPWLMHLHSLLWGALLLLGVRALYRELVSDRFVGTLAFALYALDDARGWIVSWVASRNGVIATAFSVWALVVHHRQRSGKLAAGVWLGPLLVLLGLLSGEGAIATYAYLAAYALFLDHDATLRTRILRLWPYALVLVGWRVAYRALGYGVHGSDLYVDPIDDPLSYIERVLEHGPVLISAQLGGMWSDAWTSFFAFPRLRIAVYVACIASMAVAGALFAPHARRDPLVRYGLFAGLLSILPACSVFPADRLLTWAAIGMSIALASFLAPFLKGEALAAGSGMLARIAAPTAFLYVLSNLVLAPPLVASRARGNIALRDVLGRADSSVPSDESIKDKLLLFVNPPAVPIAAYIPMTRAALGVPRAKSQRILATSTSELRIERVDAQTLRFAPAGGFLQNPSSKLMWTEKFRFHVGQRVSLGDPTVVITAIMPDGRPREMESHFEQPLESAHYVWRQWIDTRYEPWAPPAIGASVTLPSADYMQVVFGMRFPFEARYEPPAE